MDCNVHHPLWNPPAYSHSHQEADDLIQLMAESGLSLCSQSGVPTFYPPHLNHANTTINLTWVSPTCADWVTSCETDVAHVYSHLSDHAAILTQVNLPMPVKRQPRSYQNWKKLNQPSFEEALTSQLSPLLPTLQSTATDQTSLDHHADLLVQAITTFMDSLVPSKPMKANAKRWWDQSTLDPLKASAQRLRRLYQRRRTEDTKVAYLKAAGVFREAIHTAKRDHWRAFLSSLISSTLFTAASYATAEWAAPTLAVPPLRNPSGTLTSEPDEQADLLFQGTSAPTIECVLDDTLPLPPPHPNPTLFTPSDVDSVITRLLPDKAPGIDEIPNRAIQAGGPGLSQAVCHLANSCLLTSLFPTAWKVGTTIILRKPGKPD